MKKIAAIIVLTLAVGCLPSDNESATDKIGRLYSIENVSAETNGVLLAPCGTEIALPPFAEDVWKADSYKNRLKIDFTQKGGETLCILTGDEKSKDTAWFVHSPRVELTGKGERFILSFTLDTTRPMKLQGGMDKPWRSALYWYGAKGEALAPTPLNYIAAGSTVAAINGDIPSGAKSFELQIGFDSPNIGAGHKLAFSRLKLSVSEKECTYSKVGSFVSEVRRGGRVSWKANVPEGTKVCFQCASAETPEAAMKASFVGPDGTADSFYSAPFEVKGKWLRYKATLSTENPTATPVLESVMVGNVRDVRWMPYADSASPRVTMKSVSSSSDPNTPFEIEVWDEAAVVEQSFRAKVDGVEATDSFAAEGSLYRMNPPSGGWTNGLHEAVVEIADCHGNKTIAKRYFMIAQQPERQCVTLRDDGMTLIDGKPFFPIGLYAVCKREFNGNDLDRAFEGLKKGGFNFAHTYGQITDEFLECAKKYDIRLWIAGRRINERFLNTLCNNPNIIAWYLGDDTSDVMTSEELSSLDSLVKAYDPTRISCQADPVGTTTLLNQQSRYANYVTGTDVFMPEIYPVRGKEGDETDSTCVAKTISDMKCFANDVQMYGDAKPRGCWAIIQGFKGWHLWHHFPSRDRLYAMAWASVVHGANGVVWYTYGGFYDKENKRQNEGVTSTPERWSWFCETATRLKELSPFLVERKPVCQPSVDIVEGNKTDPFGYPSVSCLLKKCGNETVLIAVNSSPTSVKACFGGVPESKADVLWEKRSVPSENGTFSDSFEPFAVHIYKWTDSARTSAM